MSLALLLLQNLDNAAGAVVSTVTPVLTASATLRTGAVSAITIETGAVVAATLRTGATSSKTLEHS